MPSKRRCDAWEGFKFFKSLQGIQILHIKHCRPSQTYQTCACNMLNTFRHRFVSPSCCLTFPILSNPFQLRLQQGVLEKMEDPDLANSALEHPIMAPPASWDQLGAGTMMNSTWLTKHNTTLGVAVEHEGIGRNPSHT